MSFYEFVKEAVSIKLIRAVEKARGKKHLTRHMLRKEQKLVDLYYRQQALGKISKKPTDLEGRLRKKYRKQMEGIAGSRADLRRSLQSRGALPNPKTERMKRHEEYINLMKGVPWSKTLQRRKLNYERWKKSQGR